ncbi:MAG: hypothetical protein PHY45_04460 [Rhodocyclaceae bacterium]|nr:hypothetical protein [Rhodocyclaceae bacterium]
MAEPLPHAKTNVAMLAADVEGAMLLLSYACQSDIAVTPDTASTVTRARGLFADGRLEGDDLAGFYLAMQKLAVNVAPVTIAGLRAAMSREGSPPESRQAIRWYWIWTVCWLAILVAVQIYWVVGSTALTSLKQLNEERNKARYELVDLRAKLPRGTAPESTADGMRLTESITNLRNQADAYSHILVTWNKLLRFGLPNLNDKPTGNSAMAAEPPGSDADAARLDLVLTRTPFVLFALQAYLLPLLYGLLGSCTYVLRMLSRDIRSFSYTPESHIRYKIRMVLGTLSGLAITWFFEPGSETIRSLSPLALAFVAGYSVEILFAAMDRFVAAFSNATTNGAESPKEKPASHDAATTRSGETGQ